MVYALRGWAQDAFYYLRLNSDTVSKIARQYSVRAARCAAPYAQLGAREVLRAFNQFKRKLRKLVPIVCGFSIFRRFVTDKTAAIERALCFKRKRVVGKIKAQGIIIGWLIVMSVTLIGISSASYAAEREGPQLYDFDISELNVAEALNQFAEQTGAVLLFPYDLVDGRPAKSLNGRYGVTEALEVLLEGSGLSGSLVQGEVIRISLGNDKTKTNREDKMASGKLKKGLLASVAAFMFGGANAQDVEVINDETAEQEEKKHDEIIVTGTNIRGVRNETAPVVVYEAIDIERSGATTLERFFETLPQNLNSQTPLASVVFSSQKGSNFRGGGIDLRGLGVGTTLVLLNGRRLSAPNGESVDTSLIPLGAIERVEVLSDGASAVYGSDAIGGVVNIILRDTLEGGEINTSYGTVTDGGHDRFQANLNAGTSWKSGSGLISYSILDQSALGVSDRDFVMTPSPGDLVADVQRHSVLGALDQELTDRLSFFGNVLYATRKSDLDTNSIVSGSELLRNQSLESEQLFLSSGFEYEISDNLFFELHGEYLANEGQLIITDITDRFGDFQQDEVGSSLDFMAKIDGKLLDLPGGELRFSAGGGYSRQDFKDSSVLLGSDPVFERLERDSYFLFVEAFTPLVSEEQNIAGINRLELSAAVRHTEYSDFGGGTTPRFGLLWSPVEGLNLRGTYSTSFRAPTLSALGSGARFAQVFSPSAFGFPDTFSSDDSTILMLVGGAGRTDLTPEFSDSFTFGFDLEPAGIEGLSFSATYFNIDYTDRLGLPDSSGGFGAIFDQAGFAFVFNAMPTQLDLAGALGNIPGAQVRDFTGLLSDPTDPVEVAGVVTVILDNRLGNLASSKVEGLDFSVSYALETGIGNFNYGANVTYNLNSTQQAVPSFPEVTLLNTVGNPTALKFSTYAGWSRGGFSSQVNVNYVDSYADVFQTPEQSISSWTTVDLSMRYNFGDGDTGLLNNAALSLTVNNLFDQDPPFVDVSGTRNGGLFKPVGFDPVNANPIGRFITVGLNKKF